MYDEDFKTKIFKIIISARIFEMKAVVDQEVCCEYLRVHFIVNY